jgi:HEAT repeat protein
VIPRRLQELETELVSPDESVRQRALTELAESAHEEALEILWRAREKDTLEEFATGAFKDAVLAHPATALRHANPTIKKQSLQLSADHKNVSAIDEITRILRNDSETDMRCDAATALGDIGDELGVPALQHGVTDPTFRVRESVLRALTQITHASSERVVIEFLADHDWPMRQKARNYLENTGWAPVDRRESTSWAIAQGRFDEALKNGTEAIEPLLNAAVFVNDSEVRHWASIALTKLNSPEVVNRLHLIAETASPTDREAAQACLKMLGSPVRSLETIRATTPAIPPQQANSPPVSIFDAAIRMLAIIGEP